MLFSDWYRMFIKIKHTWDWKLTCLGTVMYGHHRMGSNVSGHNRVRAQTCLGTIMSGHNRVRAQTCLGTNVYGHKRVWAQTCVGTVIWSQSCGHNHAWSQTWWNLAPELKLTPIDSLASCVSWLAISWLSFYLILHTLYSERPENYPLC